MLLFWSQPSQMRVLSDFYAGIFPRRTQRWFMPNLHAVTDTRYTAQPTSYSGAVWDDALVAAEVACFFAQTVKDNTDGILGRAVPKLAAHGVKSAIDIQAAGRGAGYPALADGTNGSANAAYVLANQVVPFEAAGGTVDYLFMDAAMQRLVVNGMFSAPYSAFRTLDPAGANNKMTWTAKSAGSQGNQIRVAYAVSGLNTPLSVGVVGSISVVDFFQRTTVTVWGTSSLGNAYTLYQTAADYSTDLLRKYASATLSAAPQTRYGYTPVTGTDQIGYVCVVLPVMPVGATVSAGVWLRFTDNANQYRFNVNVSPAGVVSTTIIKNVAGVETTIAGPTTITGLTYTAGMRLRVKGQVVGTALSLWAWQDHAVQPTAATVTATDASLATGANAACATSVGAGLTVPYAVRFSDFVVTSAEANFDVTVNLATDGAGVATSTAAQVKAAVDASAPAAALVTVANFAGNDGSGVCGVVPVAALTTGDDGYNMSPAQAANEVVSFMTTIHASRPNIKIGIHDSVILWPYNGVVGYSVGSLQYAADYKLAVFPALMARVNAVGERLEFFIADASLEYMAGQVPSANSAADDWYARHVDLWDLVAASNVPFGRTILSLWGGNHTGGSGAPADFASDATFQSQSLLMAAAELAYLQANGLAVWPIVIGASWYKYPLVQA